MNKHRDLKCQIRQNLRIKYAIDPLPSPTSLVLYLLSHWNSFYTKRGRLSPDSSSPFRASRLSLLRYENHQVYDVAFRTGELLFILFCCVVFCFPSNFGKYDLWLQNRGFSQKGGVLLRFRAILRWIVSGFDEFLCSMMVTQLFRCAGDTVLWPQVLFLVCDRNG